MLIIRKGAGLGGPASSVTWNPADAGTNITFANGNADALKLQTASGWTIVRSNTSKSSGKRYYELTIVGSFNAIQAGIMAAGGNINTNMNGSGVDAIGYELQSSAY